MKPLVGFALLVIVSSIAATTWPAPSHDSTTSRQGVSAFEQGWRRTANGWERIFPPEVDAPSVVWCEKLRTVHPLVWAAGQLAVVLGIAAWAEFTQLGEAGRARRPQHGHPLSHPSQDWAVDA